MSSREIKCGDRVVTTDTLYFAKGQGVRVRGPGLRGVVVAFQDVFHFIEDGGAIAYNCDSSYFEYDGEEDEKPLPPIETPCWCLVTSSGEDKDGDPHLEGTVVRVTAVRDDGTYSCTYTRTPNSGRASNVYIPREHLQPLMLVEQADSEKEEESTEPPFKRGDMFKVKDSYDGTALTKGGIYICLDDEADDDGDIRVGHEAYHDGQLSLAWISLDDVEFIR